MPQGWLDLLLVLHGPFIDATMRLTAGLLAGNFDFIRQVLLLRTDPAIVDDNLDRVARIKRGRCGRSLLILLGIMLARLHQYGRESGVLALVVNCAAPLVSTLGCGALVELEALLFQGLLVFQSLIVLLLVDRARSAAHELDMARSLSNAAIVKFVSLIQQLTKLRLNQLLHTHAHLELVGHFRCVFAV